jgi:hypothetical protein
MCYKVGFFISKGVNMKELEQLSKKELIHLLLTEQAISHKFAEALRTVKNANSLAYSGYTVDHAAGLERLIRNGQAPRLLKDARERMQGDGVLTLDDLIKSQGQATAELKPLFGLDFKDFSKETPEVGELYLVIFICGLGHYWWDLMTCGYLEGRDNNGNYKERAGFYTDWEAKYFAHLKHPHEVFETLSSHNKGGFNNV